MKEEHERALVSGGMTDLHSHPFVYARDMTKLGESLESVVFVTDTNYTVKYSDDIVFVTAAVPVSITLPEARGGSHVTISRIAGAAAVSIVPSGTDTIDLAASKSITSTAEPVRLKAVKGTGYFSI